MREQERVGGGMKRGGRVDPPPIPLTAHPPIYGSPFQQGHSRWGGSVDALFSQVNSNEPSSGLYRGDLSAPRTH